MQNKIDGSNGGVLRYNDPAYHRPLFFRALDIAVKDKDLQKWKADELRREYDQDLRKEK